MKEDKEIQKEIQEVEAGKRVTTKAGEVIEKALVSRGVDFDNENQLMNQAVRAAGRQATTLKEVVDVGVTGITLQREGVITDLTNKKEKELKEDALAKVIASEKLRIEQETARTLEEGRKQLASLQNQINEVKAVKEKLDQEANQNLAYFNGHKSILKYAGCVEVMSMKYMKTMAAIGFIIMCFVKIIFSPLILTGLFIETLVDIIGGVTKSVVNNAARIILTLVLLIVILAVVVGSYFGVVEFSKFYLALGV